DRGVVSGRDEQHRGREPHLPRPDPARLLARDERVGAMDRAAGRAPPGRRTQPRRGRMSTHSLTKAALRAEGLPRRRAVNRLMSLPVGILVALYLNEFAPPSIRTGVGLALDVLNGVPAIVIGIFVFGLLVVGHGQSGFAGSFALACIMLPLVARATLEVLALVPDTLREASLGLGVPRWRTTLGIVLPQTIAS